MNNTCHQFKTPATPYQVAQYVSHLHYSGLKASSIRPHLSAIGFMHETLGHHNPTRSFLTQKLLITYSKSDSPQKSRLPITSNILSKLVRSLKTHQTSKYNTHLFTSMFTCMYHAALRSSEVCKAPRSHHTLQPSHILLTKTTLKIQLPSFKHSSSHNPPLVLHSTGNSICPVKAYRKYLKSTSHITSSAAFHFSDGSPITRLQLLHTPFTNISLSVVTTPPYSTPTHSV